MNQRILALLLKFLGAWGRGFSYEALAAEHHVSTRTIRYDLQRIDALLAENGLGALSALPEGVGLCGAEERAERIRALAARGDFYAYRLSPGERRSIIMLILLGRDGPVTLGELADELCYSRGTIAKDMESVENFLAEYELSIAQSKLQGYLLAGREQDRRRLIVKDIMTNQEGIFDPAKGLSVFDHFVLQELPELEGGMDFLRAVLGEQEARFGITFTDDDFQRVLLYLAVTLQRAARGRAPEPEETGSGDGLSLQMAEELLDALHGRYQIAFRPAERQLLARHLHSRRLFSGHDQLDGHADLYIVVRAFLYQLSEETGVDFDHDAKLQLLMANHVRGIRTRMASRERFQNPYKQQLCREYSGYYESICRHIRVLEDYLGSPIDEDERAFILSHIAASAERYTDKREVRAVVVCNAGLATANYLAEKLRRYFTLTVLDVVSSHRAREAMRPEDCDLVVSTVPFTLEGVACVTVSPMLTDQDADLIQKALIQIHRSHGKGASILPPSPALRRRERVRCILAEYLGEEQADEAADRVLAALGAEGEGRAPAPVRAPDWDGPSFAAVLDRDHILLDVPAADWRGAVRAAADPLVRLGEVERGYMDAMVRAVEENGPYFVFAPGVALAHAAPEDGVRVPCVSLARLARPVNFGSPGNDPVRFVAAVGVADAKRQVKVLFQIMNTLCDERALAALSGAADAEEVLAVITRFEEDRPE